MAFESLSEKLQNIFKNLRGKGRLSEADVKAALKEVKMALLEADVSFKVVKQFIGSVSERAVGQEVLESLTPGQMVIKIVNEEMVKLMGSETTELKLKPGNEITVLMMVGLQGAGKTTATAKIAGKLKQKGKKPLLVACDIYRPAAIEQLQSIGKQLNIEVYSEGKKEVNTIVSNALEYAKVHKNDYIIIDTAGRLHIDEELMDELDGVVKLANPHEIILVIDAMMGQDAINVIKGFNDKLPLTGCILTKLDGDTKGGVALSVRHLTNVPIKFVGDSEKMDGLSEFYPERMAERILDMGDVLSIAEKVESVISEDEAKVQAKKMKKGTYDLEDFLTNMKQIKKLGPLENILKMLPQARKMGLNNVSINPKDMAHVEAIILSMTPYERRHPEVLKASRKQRIAKGSGRSVEEVNRLLKQFESMKQMMKMVSNGNFKMPM